MSNYQFNINEIQRLFEEFLYGNDDIKPIHREPIIIDGHIHRYAVEGDKHGATSGAYCVFSDSWPAGWAQNWRCGDPINWSFPKDKLDDEGRSYFTKEVYEEAIRKSNEHQAELKKQREQKEIIASENARIRYEQLSSYQNPQFPYLKKKKVEAYNGVKFLNPRKRDEKMIIPMFNINGVVQTYQTIDTDGVKKFYPETSTKAAFFPIGFDGHGFFECPNSPIIIAEGYATAATVYNITGHPTVAAMNCGNIPAVLSVLRTKYPNRRFVIAADNDWETFNKRGNNPGIDAATKAVKDGLAEGFVFPEFTSSQTGMSDWNDYYILHGFGNTHAVLKEKISYELMTQTEREEYKAVEKLKNLAIELDKTIQIPPEDFIAGIFPRKRISAVIAAPGTGKTWFLQRLVSDLSTGGAIFDGFAEESTPKKSVVFAGEAGPALMIRRATDTDWPVNKHEVRIYGMIDAEKDSTSLMLDEEEGRKNVERIIKTDQPDIIFFDTLGSFHNSDENKANEMKPIFRWMLTIAETYNIAIVLMHHSRKRPAKERGVPLNQDDVIGSSIFNRLVSLIISIERTGEENEEEKMLLVKCLKSWFSEFIPFAFKLEEGADEKTTMKVDLAPSTVQNVGQTKFELWTFIQANYKPDEWFKISDLQTRLGEENSVGRRQLTRLLTAFANSKKLKKRGELKGTEYAVIGFYNREKD